MLLQVALQGFAESDVRGLASFLGELGDRRPGYRLAHSIAEADLILADGDSAQAIASIAGEARIATTLFLSAQRPPEAAWHVVRPTNPVQLLIGLDEVAATMNAGARAVARIGTSDRRALAKGAARRARLAASAIDTPEVPPPDVLVLDQHDDTRDHLCAILEHFGFCAYPARNGAQALWLLDAHPFQAAFLDIALDGSDDGLGIELCLRAKHRPASRPGPPSALLVVSADAQSADRVLARLAGCDAFLLKPLGRGDVARALEACNVLLPSDHRRW